MARGVPSTMPGSAPSVAELLASGRRSYSFEFFPPRTDEGERALWAALRELEPLRPTFVSVTYGAGGTTRDRTVAITGRIARETSLLPMAHLTCVGHSTTELECILASLADSGVNNVLALRGDPLAGPGTAWIPTEGGIDYASELVSFIRARGDFSVGVAAFPEGHRDAASLEADVEVLKAKRDAGAEFAVTEMVLRVSDYFALVERARAAGVDFPIIPGVMPILNLNSMSKMVELSGRDMPEEVLGRIEPLAEDPAAVRAEGIAIATELCDDLLGGGAPGLHFYTLNRSKATREIWSALSLKA
jgi:methylenetetrahydrofolate reductase (NADPH)